jgi:hypothetical protein
MTEITNIKSQHRSIQPQQKKPLDKTTTKQKGEAAVGEQENLQAVAAEIKSKRLDILLAVQTESKTTFTWQNGFLERAAAQGVDLNQLQYNGKPLTDMTPEEAAGLISEDGDFGVAKTSRRLADFVITGGGDDLKKLQAGREGIIKGFNEAEKIWGSKLPDISYQTLAKALELIDTRIQKLGGGSVVDVQA